MTHHRLLSASHPLATILLFTLLPIANAAAQTPQQQALDSIGFQRDRSYFSPEPWEHYDTVTGHDMNGILDITTVTLPNGSQWTFAYDEKDLTSVTTPFGGHASYEYDDVPVFPGPRPA